MQLLRGRPAAFGRYAQPAARPLLPGAPPMTDLQHRTTVAKLRSLLAQLQDSDVLIPNQVQNLSIVRDGEQIGFIELRHFHEAIELYEEAE